MLSMYIVHNPGHIRFDDDETKMSALEEIYMKSVLSTMMKRGINMGANAMSKGLCCLNLRCPLLEV